jgi:hypothetical protein
MPTVLDKAKKEDVQSDPFPYLLIENAISDDLCEELIKEFPSDSVVARGSDLGDNLRFSLPAPLVAGSHEVKKIWRDFISEHSSQEFFDKFNYLFEDHIKVAYPSLVEQKNIVGVRGLDDFTNSNVLIDAQICINSPVINKPSSVKIAHIDDTDKLYAGLFYLRHPDDDSQGGNLEIYKLKGNDYRIHGQRLVRGKYVKVVKTIPYKKNTLIIFLNSPIALHGVTVRQKTNHTRKFMNLVAEAKESLFSLKPFEETITDKIFRKLNI